MKQWIGLAGLCFVLMVSCTKNSGPADLPSVQPNNKLDTLVAMSAKIGGLSFSTTDVYGYNIKSSSGTASNVYNVLIKGSQQRHDSLYDIDIQINGYYGPDTYRVNPPFVTASWYYNNQRHYGTWGSIVVLSDTAYALTGTFLFLADSTLVSNGGFNVLKPF